MSTWLCGWVPTWMLGLLLALGVSGVGHLAHATLEHAPDAHSCCPSDEAPQTDQDGENDPLSPQGEEECAACHLAFSSAKVLGDAPDVGVERDLAVFEAVLSGERDVAPSRWLASAPTRGPPAV